MHLCGSPSVVQRLDTTMELPTICSGPVVLSEKGDLLPGVKRVECPACGRRLRTDGISPFASSVGQLSRQLEKDEVALETWSFYFLYLCLSVYLILNLLYS